MQTLFDFSSEIKKLCNEKKYDEALNYFKINKTNYSGKDISGNAFIIANIISALRHTGKYDAAFKFMNFYNVDINEKTNDVILSAYGWLLYSKFKSENRIDEKDISTSENDFIDEEVFEENNSDHLVDKTDIVKKIEGFLPLIVKKDNEFSKTLFSNLFKIVLKSEKVKQKPNWKFIVEFCDLFKQEDLSSECKTIDVTIKSNTKKMELASDKEYWFAYKSKAYMKLSLFKECFEISQKALETISKFHYSNDVWFARRVALSKKKLGNKDEAIEELKKVLKRKKEWFIQKELAELYSEKGDLESAFKYAMEAINNHGDLEYKVDLLYLISELLKEKGENELSFKHCSISRLIRIRKKWTITEKLNTALNNFNREAIPPDKEKDLKKELLEYWSKYKIIPTENSTNIVKSGKINKILNDNNKGKNGFIKTDDGKTYYFNIKKTEEICDSIIIGKLVSFKVIASEDGKKEQAVKLKMK